jgi:senataxin
LSKQEKKQIARQELMHSRNMKERAEKQRQRQLGGHDPKVPVIQVSTDTPKGEKHDGPGKRKRTDSPASDGSKASRPRTSDQNMPPAPENAPTGPKNQRRKIDANVPPPSSENLVKPSRDGPAYAPINSNNKTMGGPQGSSGPANPHRPPNRPGNGPRPPPPIRKKKDADPFIRPKRR